VFTTRNAHHDVSILVGFRFQVCLVKFRDIYVALLSTTQTYVSVGIATRYGLDGPGIKSLWGGGARFSASVQTGPRAHPASYVMGTGSFFRG
jgi:hypothetical protein